MNDLKISQLPLADALTGYELFPVAKQGANVAVSGATIMTYVQTQITNAIGDSINQLDEINDLIV